MQDTADLCMLQLQQMKEMERDKLRGDEKNEVVACKEGSVIVQRCCGSEVEVVNLPTTVGKIAEALFAETGILGHKWHIYMHGKREHALRREMVIDKGVRLTALVGSTEVDFSSLQILIETKIGSVKMPVPPQHSPIMAPFVRRAPGLIESAYDSRGEDQDMNVAAEGADLNASSFLFATMPVGNSCCELHFSHGRSASNRDANGDHRLTCSFGLSEISGDGNEKPRFLHGRRSFMFSPSGKHFTRNSFDHIARPVAGKAGECDVPDNISVYSLFYDSMMETLHYFADGVEYAEHMSIVTENAKLDGAHLRFVLWCREGYFLQSASAVALVFKEYACPGTVRAPQLSVLTCGSSS